MYCAAVRISNENCPCAGGGNWTIKSTSRKTPLTSPERQLQANSRPGTLKKPGFTPERGPGTQRSDADQATHRSESPETQNQNLRPAVARPLGGWQQPRSSDDGPRASFFEPPADQHSRHAANPLTGIRLFLQSDDEITSRYSQDSVIPDSPMSV